MINSQHELFGNFHAHITLSTSAEDFDPPKGWKTTIILLSKENRYQKDVMITKHFRTGTSKTRNIHDINRLMYAAAVQLHESGFDVTRVKLEHESLPTLAISSTNYRECHVKVVVPKDTQIQSLSNYVQSSNPMSQNDTHTTTFLNARFYEGSVEDVDRQIYTDVWSIQKMHPTALIKEVKIESTISDTNLDLDRWWA